MCCPKGKMLKLTPTQESYSARCVRSRIKLNANATLDGTKISVENDGSSDEAFEPLREMFIKKTGVMLPSCTQGLVTQQVSLKQTGK